MVNYGKFNLIDPVKASELGLSLLRMELKILIFNVLFMVRFIKQLAFAI